MIHSGHLAFINRKKKWKVLWNIGCIQFTEKLSLKMASAISVTETQQVKGAWTDNAAAAIYLQLERLHPEVCLVRLPDTLFTKFKDVCSFSCQVNCCTMLCCELHGLKLVFLPSKFHLWLKISLKNKILCCLWICNVLYWLY